jgi:predicted transcriptional regulator
MFSILEYIYMVRQPVSKYHLLKKVPGISTQRPDRVSHFVDMLVKNGYLETMQTANVMYYQISQKGKDAYDLWIKQFLDFMRSL